MPKSGPILIIEDDHDDQEVLREIFEEIKIPNIPRFFNSSIEALNYLLTTIEKPFLIISDINLPSMTGLEFKESINQNGYLRKKSIPFVFLSTTSEKTVIAKAYELFAQGYFIKPVTLIEIKQMVVKIIDYLKICGRPSDY